MRRRVGVAVLVALGLFAGADAGAQTTTTSTSSTSSSTSSTSVVPTTAAPTTTSTTVVHPCTGRTCAAEPPNGVLSTSSRQIAADRGSFCWLQTASPSTVCLALAATPGYQPPLLVVTQGETVTVRFTSQPPLTPLEVALARSGNLVALAAANPTSFRVDLPPGVHEQIGLITRWTQGEVPYHFRLDVRGAAQPASPTRTGGLSLTG